MFSIHPAKSETSWGLNQPLDGTKLLNFPSGDNQKASQNSTRFYDLEFEHSCASVDSQRFDASISRSDIPLRRELSRT
jgi:hypothetical protein